MGKTKLEEVKVDIPAEKKNDFSLVLFCNKGNSERVKLVLRSFWKNLLVPFNVVIIGEHQNWMNEKITVIPAKGDESMEEQIKLLLMTEEVGEAFAIIPDSTFLMNQAMMAHLLIPYVKFFSVVNGRFEATMSEAMPSVYSKDALRMMAALPDKVLTKDNRPLSETYFNTTELQTMPYSLDWPNDNILLPVISANPSMATLNDYAKKKLFFYISQKSWDNTVGYIQNLFPVASDFEAPVAEEN